MRRPRSDGMLIYVVFLSTFVELQRLKDCLLQYQLHTQVQNRFELTHGPTKSTELSREDFQPCIAEQLSQRPTRSWPRSEMDRLSIPIQNYALFSFGKKKNAKFCGKATIFNDYIEIASVQLEVLGSLIGKITNPGRDPGEEPT